MLSEEAEREQPRFFVFTEPHANWTSIGPLFIMWGNGLCVFSPWLDRASAQRLLVSRVDPIAADEILENLWQDLRDAGPPITTVVIHSDVAYLGIERGGEHLLYALSADYDVAWPGAPDEGARLDSQVPRARRALLMFQLRCLDLMPTSALQISQLPAGLRDSLLGMAGYEQDLSVSPKWIGNLASHFGLGHTNQRDTSESEGEG